MDLIWTLLNEIVGNPVQTVIAIAVAFVIVAIIKARRTMMAAGEFEKAYDFRPGNLDAPIVKAVRLTIEGRWPAVEQAEWAMTQALDESNRATSKSNILDLYKVYEERRSEYWKLSAELGEAIKLAARFGYLSEVQQKYLHPTILRFAKENGYLASA